MARQKGMLNLSGNLEPLAGAPLDSRSITPTVADLYIASNWPYKYIGMKTTVTDTGDTYRLVNLDVTQESSWVNESSGGSGASSLSDLEDVDLINPEEGETLIYDGEGGWTNGPAGQTYSDFTGATEQAAGAHGLVPAPTIGDISKFLKGDGTWGVIPTIGIGGGFAPIGTIISYMGTTAPQDYLICDGTTYNIADYKQLADFFAAQFGSANFFGGDGITTFKVPDLRGEFLRGSGTNSHANQGNGQNVGVHQDGTMHPYEYVTSTGTGAFRGYTNNDGAVVSDKQDSLYTVAGNGQSTETRNAPGTTFSGNSVFTSRPTNTSVLYCIKAVVAGDVYSTTERVVGTWIDGKPVYEKTFVNVPFVQRTDVSVNQADAVLFNSSESSVLNLVGYENLLLDNGQGSKISLGSIITGTTDYSTCEVFQEWKVLQNSRGIIISTTRNDNNSALGRTATVTIRYTKTTD